MISRWTYDSYLLFPTEYLIITFVEYLVRERTLLNVVVYALELRPKVSVEGMEHPRFTEVHRHVMDLVLRLLTK